MNDCLFIGYLAGFLSGTIFYLLEVIIRQIKESAK